MGCKPCRRRSNEIETAVSSNKQSTEVAPGVLHLSEKHVVNSDSKPRNTSEAITKRDHILTSKTSLPHQNGYLGDSLCTDSEQLVVDHNVKRKSSLAETNQVNTPQKPTYDITITQLDVPCTSDNKLTEAISTESSCYRSPQSNYKKDAAVRIKQFNIQSSTFISETSIEAGELKQDTNRPINSGTVDINTMKSHLVGGLALASVKLSTSVFETNESISESESGAD